jgi:hypothetical protein
MAKRQSRRTVSLERITYERALEVAHSQGLSLAQLVTKGLWLVGVKVAEQKPMKPEDAERAQRNRARGMEMAKAKRATGASKRPGPIRQALGDSIAEMLGEP